MSRPRKTTAQIHKFASQTRNNIQNFLDLLQQNYAQEGFNFSVKKHYNTLCKLLMPIQLIGSTSLQNCANVSAMITKFVYNKKNSNTFNKSCNYMKKQNPLQQQNGNQSTHAKKYKRMRQQIRLNPGNRKQSLPPDLQQQLYHWGINQFKLGYDLTPADIDQQARYIGRRIPNLRVTTWWIQMFLLRHSDLNQLVKIVKRRMASRQVKKKTQIDNQGIQLNTNTYIKQNTSIKSKPKPKKTSNIIKQLQLDAIQHSQNKQINNYNIAQQPIMMNSQIKNNYNNEQAYYPMQYRVQPGCQYLLSESQQNE